MAHLQHQNQSLSNICTLIHRPDPEPSHNATVHSTSAAAEWLTDFIFRAIHPNVSVEENLQLESGRTKLLAQLSLLLTPEHSPTLTVVASTLYGCHSSCGARLSTRPSAASVAPVPSFFRVPSSPPPQSSPASIAPRSPVSKVESSELDNNDLQIELHTTRAELRHSQACGLILRQVC